MSPASRAAAEAARLVTLDELPDLLFLALQQQPHADGGEAAAGHLLVPQHPLQQPLQVGLRGLQPLATAREVSDVGGPFPEREHALQDTGHTQGALSSETKSPHFSFKKDYFRGLGFTR